MNDRRVLIIGGGAAGMMAAITLAQEGFLPEIYEKNDKLGRKLFITGKGRCNLMNDCDAETIKEVGITWVDSVGLMDMLTPQRQGAIRQMAERIYRACDQWLQKA